MRNRGLSNSFPKSWRQGVSSSSPSPQEQGCKALQQGCRSGAEAQAAASKLGQPANCIPNARWALWSAQLRPFSSRRSCRRPCCRFQPLGGHRQNPALLSIFFFFLPLPGRLPTHYLYIQIKRRSPFLLGLAGVGQEQRAVPASPPLTTPGDSFSGGPSQKPPLGGGDRCPFSPALLTVEAGKSALDRGGAPSSSGRRLSALSLSPARAEGCSAAEELELREPLSTSGCRTAPGSGCCHLPPLPRPSPIGPELKRPRLALLPPARFDFVGLRLASRDANHSSLPEDGRRSGVGARRVGGAEKGVKCKSFHHSMMDFFIVKTPSAFYYFLRHLDKISSCPILCSLVDHHPPDASVHGILQTRILKWVVTSVDLPDPGIEPSSLTSPPLAENTKLLGQRQRISLLTARARVGVPICVSCPKPSQSQIPACAVDCRQQEDTHLGDLLLPRQVGTSLLSEGEIVPHGGFSLQSQP
ncbi:uncharacterized protein LOC122693151 [Cervus elaphus]|uniref:uncharacterized protein LOC122693151 n=1 Tax=Cervus elaphus TaxID=9860 RepID=UPI001CC2B705|nr:uncharacterized protein LOC122693151 [Cervus elaphus]